MNNNHPFLPRASNNISIEKSNDAVTWLNISMITSNILLNKTKGALNCTFTDTCQGFLMLTLSFVGERKNLRPQQPIWVSAMSNITFQRQICFSNKGLFEEAINLHAIIPWLLSLCYALFCFIFWADSYYHSKIAIILEILPSFVFSFAFIDAWGVTYCDDSLKKAPNFFWLQSSKLPLCLRS